MSKLEKLMPRCKTKDTDDFPEIVEHLDADPEAGCFNCRVWEALDQYITDRIIEELLPLEQLAHNGILTLDKIQNRLDELRGKSNE